MNLLSLLGVSQTYAAASPVSSHDNFESAHHAAHAAAHGGFLSMLPMLIIFIAVFYFLLVRPQQKRAKEHQSLVDGLSVGDEILTTSGIVGRLVKLRDNYIVVSISAEVEVTMQKGAVASVLPKGTLESVQ